VAAGADAADAAVTSMVTSAQPQRRDFKLFDFVLWNL